MAPALVGAARLIKAATGKGAGGVAFLGVDVVAGAGIPREAVAGAGVVLREIGLGGNRSAASDECCS